MTRTRRTVDNLLAQRICDLYLSGLGSDAISVQVERSPSTVLRVLYERQVPLRRTHKQPSGNHLPEDEIVARYQAGESSHDLASVFNVQHSSIGYVLQRRGVFLRTQKETSRKFHCDPSIFTARPISDLGAYLCGLMATDGCLWKYGHSSYTVKLGLQSRDDAVLQLFKDAVKYDGPLHSRDRSKEGRQTLSILDINSKPLFDAIAALGIAPRKTWTLEVDAELADRPAFWMGAWDGDGNVGWTVRPGATRPYAQIGFISCSKRFAEQCHAFCEKSLPAGNRKLHARSDGRGRRSTQYRLCYACRNAYRVVKAIYGHAEFGIPRKLAAAREIINSYESAILHPPIAALSAGVHPAPAGDAPPPVTE